MKGLHKRNKKPGIKFYYRGKTFDNEKDFEDYVKKWPELEVDFDYIDKLLQVIRETIQINYDVRGGKLTNREALILIRGCSDTISPNTSEKD